MAKIDPAKCVARRKGGVLTVQIPSESRANIIHRARLIEGSGEAFCDCEGFRRYGHCWHIDAVKLLSKETKPKQKRRDPEQVIDEGDPYAELLDGFCGSQPRGAQA